MRKEMFEREGNWYKGNLHSHTVNSDGKLTPEQAVTLYRQYGYNFICFSEHDYYTDLREKFDCEDFILLPGVEASAWLMNEDKSALIKTHHIHGILGNSEMQAAAKDKLLQNGERLTPPVYTKEWDGLQVAQQLSDSLRERGCFTTYNHPIWSRVDMEEVSGLKDIWAIEVYNYGTVVECGEGQDCVFWDAMLKKGTHIHGFASDDNHNPGKFFDSLGGYVMVKSEELSHEAIVNHLLKGDYYFTGGPRIYQWGLEENRVFVECSEVERINFIVGGYVGRSETLLKHEDSLTGGFHILKGDEKYVRIECVDNEGRMAWTNVMWL